MTDGLVDRDALGKLVAADLWQETLEILELERVWRLPSAHAGNLLNDIGTPGRGRPALPPERVAEIEPRVRQVAGSLPSIGAMELDPSLVDRLIQHPEIDSGEAQLLAALEVRPGDCLLITGDKRFIGALKHHEPDLFEARRDRLVSLERCRLRLAQRRGVNAIRPKTRRPCPSRSKRRPCARRRRDGGRSFRGRGAALVRPAAVDPPPPVG